MQIADEKLSAKAKLEFARTASGTGSDSNEVPIFQTAVLLDGMSDLRTNMLFIDETETWNIKSRFSRKVGD